MLRVLSSFRSVQIGRSQVFKRRQSNFVAKCPEPEFDTGCTYCNVDFSGSGKSVDYERPLRNTKSHPWKHLLVLDEPSKRNVHYNDWPSRLESSGKQGYVIGEMNDYKRDIVDAYHPVLISMTDLKWQIKPDIEPSKEEITFGLYPDGKEIKVARDKLEEFMIGFLRPFPKPEDSDSEQIKEIQVKFQNQFEQEEIKEDLILVCGHTKRDERCGKLAPLILDELNKVIEKKQLENIKTGVISHIGGHIYAGNVLIFKSSLKKVIWYGRVLPLHVQGIIEETILKDNIIEELYRG